MRAPAWSRWLLGWVVPAERREDVLGDLEEVHRRRVKHRGQLTPWFRTSLETFPLAAAFLVYRLREREQGMGRVSSLDVRLALRLIRKQPIMALTVILAMAMGIALATTGFTFLDAALNGKLPMSGGDRFVRIEVQSVPDGRAMSLDLARYRLFQEAESFRYVGAADGEDLNLVHGSGKVDSLRGAFITPGTFRFLPYVPILGRSMTPSDGEPGAEPVAVLRESLWRQRFDGRRNVIGEVINVAGREHTIVGVLDDEAGFPAGGALWLPLDDRFLGGSEAGPRRGLTFFGVLREGVDAAAAQAEIATLSAAQGTGTPVERQSRVRVAPYVSTPWQARVQITGMVLVLVLLLVVIAANVANLVLARTAARADELAMRTALGAGRWRLVGQLAIEVGLLGVIAAGLGLAASHRALGWLEDSVPERPFWMTFELSPRTLLFVMMAALLASIVGGVLPALRATRHDVFSTAHADQRSASGLGLGRIGATMMVVELALSVALLSGALVMARGLTQYLDQAVELPADKILAARLLGAREAPAPHGTDGGKRPGVAPLPTHAITAALQHTAGVVAVGSGSDLPGNDAWERWVEVDDDAGSSNARAASAQLAPVARVTPGFLEALDARAVAGRLFREADVAPNALPVAVVNEPFVRMFLGGGNAIGRRVRVPSTGASGSGAPGEPAPWREIVGVVPDLGLSAADPDRAAGLYLPSTGEGNQLFLALRSDGNPRLLDGPLRQIVAGIDPNIRILWVGPLESVNAAERNFMATFARVISGMGVVALALSLVCVYAMLSFAVSRRTREIGIRVAMGATRRQIARVILGRLAKLLSLGGGLGAIMGLALISAQDALWETRLPTGETWVLPFVVVTLALVGVAACWVPMRRALRIRPAEALRLD